MLAQKNRREQSRNKEKRLQDYRHPIADRDGRRNAGLIRHILVPAEDMTEDERNRRKIGAM